MANVRVIATQRNARLDALNTAINVSGPGKIKIYSATQATNADTAIGAQVLIVTLLFPNPAAPSGASAGVLTFGTIAAVNATGAGTNVATWARITNGADAAVFDCDVTATGGGGTIQLNTTSIVNGGPVQITSFTLTDPAS